ncbi:hypothetical protein Droror1_Dr00023354 [Drosera rotundifolia]
MERKEVDEEDDDVVCLDRSFFIDDNYQLTTFEFGSQVIELYCLHSASTDFDLTGQLVWPGAMLLNDYLSKNAETLKGCSVIELGSGVGITGILCRRFCAKVVMTDHNDEVLKILKKNIELHASAEDSPCFAELYAQKLEWGDSDQINGVVRKYPEGFDLILGADIYILFYNRLFFQQSSIPPLFETVRQLLQMRGKIDCKFILGYVSRAKMMDTMVIAEAGKHGMLIEEVAGTRTMLGYLEGIIFEISMR